MQVISPSHDEVLASLRGFLNHDDSPPSRPIPLNIRTAPLVDKSPENVDKAVKVCITFHSTGASSDISPGPFNFPFFPAFGGGMEEGARAPRAPVRGYRP